MLRAFFSRLRDRVALDDADERIEGTGEAIVSPQHRRSPSATRELERLEELADERRGDDH